VFGQLPVSAHSRLSLRRGPASLTLIILVATFAQLLPMIGSQVGLTPRDVAAAAEIGYQGPSMTGNSGSESLLITAPTEMSEAWNLAGKRQELADQALAGVGDSGTRSWTFSSSREWAGWLVALRPG